MTKEQIVVLMEARDLLERERKMFVDDQALADGITAALAYINKHDAPSASQPAPDRWADVRKAFADGKRIEYRYPFAHDKNDPTPSTMSAWFTISHPDFDSTPSMEFRIAPARWADVRKALRDGIKIQYRARAGNCSAGEFGAWQAWPHGFIDRLHDTDPNIEFRIAPPKKWRPFTAEEVPVGRIVRGSWVTGRLSIVGTEYDYVQLGQSRHVTLDGLLGECKFDDDTPCGVEMEEDER